MAKSKLSRSRTLRAARALALLGAGAALAGACTLPGDFDDLEGGAPALGGSSGGTECEENSDCNDDDPCTEDVCDTSGDVPACTNAAREGVFPDGFAQTLEAEKAHRVTLAKNDFDKFYLSVFAEEESTPRLELYEVSTTGDELELAADSAALLPNGIPASALGMIASTDVPFRLYGYVGIDDEGTGRVDLVTFNDELEVLNTETLTTEYQLGVPYRAPIAWSGGGSVYGAFIETLGRVGFHTVGGAPEVLQTLGLATQLAPLVNEKGEPGVLFTTLGAATEGGKVFAQAVGGTQVEVTQCDPAQNADELFYAASSLIAGIKGVNLTSFTHLDQDSGFVTETNRAVVCSSALPNGCVAGEPDAGECAESTAQGGRAIAQDAIRHPGSAPEVILHAFAMPQIVPDDSLEEKARVDLTMISQVLDLSNIDGDDPTKPALGVEQIGEPIVLSSLPLTELTAGADLPELRIIDDHILITWLERSDAGVDRVQVQRLAICEAAADSGN